MIPKRIFYVWGAGERKPRDVQVCIQTWRQVMPDYEIIELNEDDTTYFDYQKEIKENKWFRTVYENKMWAYVADYIRIKVLYEHGGIYFDTDVSAVKTLDVFLNDKCFVGMQDSKQDGQDDFVEPAILGAQKHNKFLKFIMDIYNDDIWKLPIYTMPQLFKYTIDSLYAKNLKPFGSRKKQNTIKYPDITIYPEGIFIPFRCTETFSSDCVKDDTYTIHWWGGSWTKPEILHWLTHKHLEQNLKLLDIPCITKYCVFSKTTILKIASYKNKKLVYFVHIPLLKITDDKVYLFKCIRILKKKK